MAGPFGRIKSQKKTEIIFYINTIKFLPHSFG